MSLALYRKYRPQTFAEVIGQEHVTEPLRQALRSGRIHHAYLFSGPRGCGKTSSARILALSLNCENGPTPDPCGTCDQCVAITAGNSLDVVELDAASHGGVDDARDLRERAFFSPVSARFKVYIVDEAHMVSREGFNALLKLVEEPPEFLKFVFATTEPDKVLATIRSRTHHYPFRLAGPRVLQAHLVGICAREEIEVDPRALTLVTRAGAGSFRDALSVLDQLIAGAGPEGVTYDRALALLGVTDLALLDEAVDALAARDGGAVFQTVARVVDAGHDPRRFAADLLERLRDLIILKAVPDAIDRNLIDVDADQLSRMTQQAGSFGEAELSRAADLLNDGLTEMRGTTSPRLVLELTCARVLLPGAARDEASTLARVDRLERRMAIGSSTEAGASTAGAAPIRTAAPAPFQSPPVLVASPQSEVTDHRAKAGSGNVSGHGNRSVHSPSASPGAGAGAGAAPRPAAGAPATPPAGDMSAGAPAKPPAGDLSAGGWPTVAQTGADEMSSRPPSAATQQPAQPVEIGATASVVPVGGAIDAAGVRRVWSDVLDAVRTLKRTPHALLLNAQVTAVSEKTITVSFNSAALARQFEQGVNRDFLSRALREVLGIERTITTAVQGAEPQLPAAASQGFAQGDEPTDDAPAEDEPKEARGRVSGEDAAMALLKSGLGAQVIGEVEQG